MAIEQYWFRPTGGGGGVKKDDLTLTQFSEICSSFDWQFKYLFLAYSSVLHPTLFLPHILLNLHLSSELNGLRAFEMQSILKEIKVWSQKSISCLIKHMQFQWKNHFWKKNYNYKTITDTLIYYTPFLNTLWNHLIFESNFEDFLSFFLSFFLSIRAGRLFYHTKSLSFLLFLQMQSARLRERNLG